jgi:hypothetical protein
LELLGIGEFCSYSLEVSSYGVAGGASGVEPGFSGFGVTHEDAGGLHSGDVVASYVEAVDVGGYVRDLVAG